MKNNSLFKSLFLLAAMLFANIVTNAQSTASDVVVVDLINNGDMEGNDVSSFRVKVGAGDINPAVITDGVGVNGSRGIKVEATEKIAEAWDNQFWFVLNRPVSAGTRIRVSFDYRADQGTVVSKESHAEPGNYISWGPFGGNITFSTGWNHFSYEDLLTSEESPDQNPMRSVAFTFNANFEDANNYYFDNIQFEVVMEEQCPKPTFVRNGDEVTIQSLFNATIYYTTDGSTPTTASPIYTTPLAFTQDATIKAIAVLAGYETSLVATYEFENVPVVTNSEPYAVLSDNNTVLTFYYDDQKAARNGMSIGPYTVNATYNVDEREWANHVLDITSVVFNPSFAGCETITSTEGWFSACENIQSITGLEYLNTLNVTSMYGMFYDCKSLLSLDISHFVTSKVTNMSWMFANCSSITSLDVSHFDTSKVKYIQGLFCGCGLLGSLDVSNFSTSNVIDMSWLFYNCPNLTSLDVSNFMTNNVTNMERMFQNCSSLPSLDLSNFNTDKVTNMALMFSGCTGLTSLDVSHFNTEKVTDMGNMFFNCSGLTSLDVSHFDTQNVWNMNQMFAGCSGLTSLDVSGFNTQNVTSMREMFGGCSGLTSLNVTGFNTQNVTKMFGMFASCSSLTSLDVTGFNTQNVTDMQIMFSGCSALTSLDVSHFNTQNVTSMGSMFKDCVGLTSLDVSHFNTQNVTSMNAMFYGCSSLTSLDVTGFNTQNVTDMRLMFYGCSGLTTIYVGNEWSTAAVTEGNDMFTGCASLVGGSGTHYDANHTDHTYARIDGGPNSQTPGYFTLSGAQPWVDYEPYAVLSNNNTKVTFYYDGYKAARNGMSVGPFSEAAERPWHNSRTAITTVVFDPSFADCTTLTSTAYWFFECFHLTTITGIENLKTDNVTDMRLMFRDCSALTSLDVTHFNTQNVTLMSGMFMGCSGLTSLDVTHFNTQNVTNMGWMFAACGGLTSIDVSQFKTDNVTSIEAMFFSCSGLTSLDVTHFNTQNMTDMMNMFLGCSGLTSLDLSNFNTQNLNWMYRMFYDCSGLTTIYVSSGWSTAVVTEGEEVFTGCSSLVGGAGTHFDQTHTDYTYARIDGGPNSQTPGYFTDKNAPAVGELVLTGKNANYWYNETGDQSGDAAIKINTALPPGDVSVWESNVLSTFVANQLNFTTTSGDAVNNVTGRTEFTTNDHWVAVDDGRILLYEDGNMQGEVAEIDPESGMIFMLNTEVTRNLLSTTNGSYLALPLCVKAYQDNTELTVTNGAFTVLAQKPIEFESLVEAELSLGTDAEVVVNMYDIVTLRDWRGVRLDRNASPNLFEHYRVYSPTITGMGGSVAPNSLIMTDLNSNDGTLHPLSEVAPDIIVSHDTSNGYGAPSTLTIVNHAGALGNFNLYVPVSVSHEWGTLSDQIRIRVVNEQPTEPEPYAVLSENNTVVTFYYDNQKQARGGMDINNSFIDNSPYGSATTAVIDASFADYKPTSTASWFCNCFSLTNIMGLENLKTENVTDMSDMFYNCSGLTNLDLSGFNTQNVTDMRFMFWSCSGLTNLDVTHFNTQNVTNMRYMFRGCSSLTHLDMTGFNTQNVMSMSSMFWGCSGLTSLDVTHFNTQNVTSMYGMFKDCFGLTSLDVTHFNTQNVTDMGGMFDYCFGLTNLDVTGFNTQNVTDMGYMFSGCYGLTSLDVTGFNTQNVTRMNYMFYDCSGLMNLDVSHFNMQNVTNMEDIFRNCSSLASIIAGNANIPAEEYARIGNPNLLVYVNEPSLAPEGVQNVVINGQAQEIVLTDAEGNNNWFCPQEFRAEKISYTREFRQRTQIGVSRGWESIALPFTVENITHESKGAIAPFGNDASDLHFWLRRLGRNGLASSQQMEANVPYVISMPNTDEYPERYNLSGRVTFSAENVMVPVTDPVMDETNDLAMAATFMRMANEEVYALNVGEERNGRPEGSIFERNYREVRPFEAFTMHMGAGPAPQYFALGDLTTTSLETVQSSKIKVQSENEWFTLDGRKLDKQPTQKGVYIQNGAKVVISR